MNVGHLLTAWTIRIALLCYVAVLAMLLSRNGPMRRWQWGRAIWTVGCLFFVGHVAAAFQFYHHWSHLEAFDNTAKQTKELMGWEFGYGIFFSYLFMVLWITDAASWWAMGERYIKRPLWLSLPLHAFLLFIAFNGTVVFKGGVIRAGGIVATLGLAIIVVCQMKKLRTPVAEPKPSHIPSVHATANSFRDTDARYE